MDDQQNTTTTTIKSEPSKMTTEEKNAYFAQKNRESYVRKKETVLRRKILKRIENNQPISEESVRDPARNWSDEEKERLMEYIHKHKESRLKYRNEYGKVVSTMKELSLNDKQFVNNNLQRDTSITDEKIGKKIPESALRNRIDEDSKGFYQLYAEDDKSEGYRLTIERLKDRVFTFEQFSNVINWLIENKVYFLKNKQNKIQQNVNITGYISRMKAILSILNANNILDIYKHPERFHNQLVLSHLSMNSVKDYASLPVTLYKISEYYEPLSYLQKAVHEDQITKLKGYVKQGILFAKQNETERLMTEAYYKWEDIRVVPNIIAEHLMSSPNDIDLLRDLVITTFYIKEIVLRDNLGSILVGFGEPPASVMKSENYLDINTGVLYLNDFKTSGSFYYKGYKQKVFPDTMVLVRRYIEAMRNRSGGVYPTYLITKKDATQYKHGKLSGYIKKMMEKYTGADNFTINSFRHSVATYHRHSPLPIKEHLSFMLHHSFQQHVKYERHSSKFMSLPILKHNHFKPAEDDVNDNVYLNKRIYCIHTHNRKAAISVGIVRMNKKYKDPSFKNRKGDELKKYEIELIDVDPTKKSIITHLPDYQNNNYALM